MFEIWVSTSQNGAGGRSKVKSRDIDFPVSQAGKRVISRLVDGQAHGQAASQTGTVSVTLPSLVQSIQQQK